MAFANISGLSNEVVERLDRARPQTFGEARRLPGLTPAALSTLLVFLSLQQKAV
jgi:tRNA uridine 5-carboxymethylaminomethyl modification enzyme